MEKFSTDLNELTSEFDGKPVTKEEQRNRLRAIHRNGGWPLLREEIIKYNKEREDLLRDMDNNKDRVFQGFLKMAKRKVGPKAVDEMVNVAPPPVVDLTL